MRGLGAFADELEKIAAGPAVQDRSDFSSRSTLGSYHSVGLTSQPDYLENKAVLSKWPKARRSGLIQIRSGLPDEKAREVKRHELVHYLQDKKRQAVGAPDPAHGSFARFKNEMAAYAAQTPKSATLRRRIGGKLLAPLSSLASTLVSRR